jgi:hypothetical protein
MIPNEIPRQEIDWESCTFEGSEREQLRVWSQLPLRRKLMALEEMGDLARKMLEWRKSRGLPLNMGLQSQASRVRPPPDAPPRHDGA